jgi:hypothetical protein
MENPSASNFLLSPVGVRTMPETTFFFVAGEPVEIAALDRMLDILLERLYAAKELAQLAQVGPDITRYYPQEPGRDRFRMEVGIPVKAGTQPAGEAQVKTLPPFPCAGVLLWGSLAQTPRAYEAVAKELKGSGLVPSGENREWNYFFEAVESPNNLIGIYMGIQSQG